MPQIWLLVLGFFFSLWLFFNFRISCLALLCQPVCKPEARPRDCNKGQGSAGRGNAVIKGKICRTFNRSQICGILFFVSQLSTFRYKRKIRNIERGEMRVRSPFFKNCVTWLIRGRKSISVTHVILKAFLAQKKFPLNIFKIEIFLLWTSHIVEFLGPSFSVIRLNGKHGNQFIFSPKGGC